MENIIVYFLFAHYVADFICQPDIMATSKSRDLGWLFLHVVAYMLVLFLFATLAMLFGFFGTWYFSDAVIFALANGGIHLAVDFVTSKINAHYWEKKQLHKFFLGVGIDQLIHQITIVYTLSILTHA